jgi:hypothetical protein
VGSVLALHAGGPMFNPPALGKKTKTNLKSLYLLKFSNQSMNVTVFNTLKSKIVFCTFSACIQTQLYTSQYLLKFASMLIIFFDHLSCISDFVLGMNPELPT